MKVKELAEIFKISAAELLAILPNVGVDVSQKEETNVDKEVEKKLAKRYGVPYPFKKAAPKPKAPAPAPAKKEEPKKAVQAQKAEAKANPTKTKEAAKVETKKAAPVKTKEAPKPETKKQEQKQTPAKPVEVKPTIKVEQPRRIIEDEIIQPRVDEATLEKYQEFLEDDEYNITRENKGSKRRPGGEDAQSKQRKKNFYFYSCKQSIHKH